MRADIQYQLKLFFSDEETLRSFFVTSCYFEKELQSFTQTMLSVCQKIVLNQIIPKTQGHFVTMATLSVVSNNRPNDYPNWLDGLVFFTDGIPDWYQEQLEWEADKLLQSAELERINEIEQELKEREEKLLLEQHNQEVQQETKRLFQKAFTTFYNKNVVSSAGSKRYNGNSKAKTNLQSFEADAHDDTDSTINKVKPSLRSKFKEVTKERKEINELINQKPMSLE